MTKITLIQTLRGSNARLSNHLLNQDDLTAEEGMFTSRVRNTLHAQGSTLVKTNMERDGFWA